MKLLLMAFFLLNALGFTLPIILRMAFLVSDWLDGKLEDKQRKA